MPAGRPFTPAMRESLAPLALREYRLLFTAQAVSLLGSWMTPAGLAFAVLDLTDSATAVGIVLGAELVPLAGLLLVGGVWGDRLARARLMVLSDVASAAAQATGAILLLTGTAEVWHLVVVARPRAPPTRSTRPPGPASSPRPCRRRSGRTRCDIWSRTSCASPDRSRPAC